MRVSWAPMLGMVMVGTVGFASGGLAAAWTTDAESLRSNNAPVLSNHRKARQERLAPLQVQVQTIPRQPNSNFTTAHFGQAPELGLTITPTQFRTRSDGSQELVYEVALANNGHDRAEIRYAIQLLSDIGEAPLPPAYSDISALDAHADRAEIHAVDASGISDGYYVLRVTAAKVADVDDVETASLYMEIRRNQYRLLEMSDWYQISRANMGRTAP